MNTLPRSFTLGQRLTLVTACGLAAGFNNVYAQDEPAAPVVAEAQGPLVLQARPQRIDQQHQVQFDNDGNVQHENHTLRLNLILALDDDLPLLGYRDLMIDRVVTDAAEELRSMNGPSANQMMHNIFNPQHQPQQTQIGVYAQLPVPSRASRTLSEVSGRAVLRLARGPLQEAVLGPFGDVAGKRARIRDIPGSQVGLTQNQGRLRVEMSQTIREMISRIRLVDERGADVPAQMRNAGSNNQTHYLEFHTPPQDGFTVVFELFDEVVEREAVFSLTDVPLPVPQGADAGVELVLDTVPVGRGVEIAPREALPVIVEE